MEFSQVEERVRYSSKSHGLRTKGEPRNFEVAQIYIKGKLKIFKNLTARIVMTLQFLPI